MDLKLTTMKTNYIHDCITTTRNNGHVIESRSATRQVEELEKVNLELLEALEILNKAAYDGKGLERARKIAKEAINKATK